jgi:hypothetical protein
MLVSIGAGGTAAIAGCAEQGEAEFEVDDYEIPESGEVREPVEISITFENVGDGDGTLEDTALLLSSRQLQFDTVPYINLDIPAGETAVWNHSFIPESGGEITFQYGNEVEQDILIDPESKAPRIQQVELITGWESFGDVSDNAIESTTVESDVAVGARYDYWHEGGTHAITIQAEIENEDGERYDIRQQKAEQLTDSEGWDTWEWHLQFSTDEASPGEYEAIVQIRDDDAGETSEAVSTAFIIEE